MSSPSDPTVLDRELYAAKPMLAHAEMELAGRYTLVACRGRGGIGEVWEALVKRTGRRVAVKLLLPGWWPNDSVRERFVREGRLAATLQHRNIVEILEAGESREGQPFIAMELLDGPPLHTLVERSGPMPWVRVRRMLLQISSALDHAHGIKIVHRDVKPSNVMLAGDEGPLEVCKLVDFGIAKQNLAHLEVKHLTGEGQMLGSPGFMSPEQLQGRPTDIRGDVYGLGCTAYYLLTGQVPFPGNTVHEMIHSALYDDPRPLELTEPLDDGLRRAVQAVLHRAVHRDPAERYPSMLDFVVALNQIPQEAERLSSRASGSTAPEASAAEPAAKVPPSKVPPSRAPASKVPPSQVPPGQATASDGSATEVPRSDRSASKVPPTKDGPAKVASTRDPAVTPVRRVPITGGRGTITTHVEGPLLQGRPVSDALRWAGETGFVEVARLAPDIMVVHMSGRVGPGAAWLFEQHLVPLIARHKPVQLFWHLGDLTGYPAEVREASLHCLTEHRDAIASMHLRNGPGVVGMAVSLAAATLSGPPHVYDDDEAWRTALDTWLSPKRRPARA